MNANLKPTPELSKPDSRDAIIADLTQQLAVKNTTIQTMATHTHTITVDNIGLRNSLFQANEEVSRWRLYALLAGTASFWAGRITR